MVYKKQNSNKGVKMIGVNVPRGYGTKDRNYIENHYRYKSAVLKQITKHQHAFLTGEECSKKPSNTALLVKAGWDATSL